MSDIARSRWVREIVLRMLVAVDGAGMGLGLTWPQVRAGFSRRQQEAPDSELRRALNDLVDDALIVRQWDGDLCQDMFRIASRGRDFVAAGLPWDKIDEFTGGRIG